jgi:hypothetical protein
MPSTMNRLLLPLALALAFLAPVLASPSSARALENRVGGQKLASHVGVSAQSDVASESRWGKTRSRMDFTSGYLLAPGGRPGSYTPDRVLPTDKHGVPVPDSPYPHTQLGRSKPKYGSEPQAREWDYGSNGNLQPQRDIDFTDHGFPDAHPHVPHQHKLTPNNPELAPKGGYSREKGGGRPL